MTGIADDLDPVTANLADLVRAAADAAPERPAMICPAAEYSWRDLDAAVDAGVQALAERGLDPGDRIVLGLPTGPVLAAALFATLRAGMVAVPVGPARADLSWVAQRTGASAVITDEPVDGVARLGSAEIETWWTGDRTGRPAVAGGEDIALLARAGREGPPVMLAHRALAGAAYATRRAPALGMRPTDRVLQVLPLFHVVGLVTAFLPAALAGATVVIPDFTGDVTRVEAALHAIVDRRVSVLPAEPTLYRQLDRQPGFERALATVRLMTSGSSALDPADLVAIRTATGQAVREGYGISEAAATVTSTLMCPVARPGSVGLPYRGIEVRIVTDDDDEDDDRPAEPAGSTDTSDGDDPSDDAEAATSEGGDADTATSTTATSMTATSTTADVSVSAGEVGPIAVRGVTLFSGYWPDGHGGPDDDGWFVTGDIGYLDDSGELHMVDRVAETMVVAGFTVYPREVEDVLVTHPYVADAAVVGVPGRAGQTVVAALVPQPGTRPTAEDLDEFVADKLAPFKRPATYRVVGSLPRTEVGRLDRDSVRETFIDAGVARPGHLRAADDPPRRSTDERPAARGDEAADRSGAATGAADSGAGIESDAAPELHDLGRKLPARSSRGQRSAQDTDDDLF